MNHTFDEAARRGYWTEQMEHGQDLIETALDCEVRECGEPFASIAETARAAGAELLLSESKIAGDFDRVFHLRASVAEQLTGAALEMNRRGWVLKIEDAYRSPEMQAALVRKPALFDAILRMCIWENGGALPPVRTLIRRAGVLVANTPKTGTHMAGSAVDISVCRRSDGAELPRGGPYLEMSERTPMLSPFVTEEERRNRLTITAIMNTHGFVHFPFEFWHFNQGDALAAALAAGPIPALFGPVHWDADANRVRTCESPSEPLCGPDRMQAEIEASVQRLGRCLS